MASRTWQETVSLKQRELRDSIPREWIDDNLKVDMISKGLVNTREYLDDILPEEEKSITSRTIMELSQAIGNGELTALEVTKAFTHRAMFAHQILNCCSEIFINQALERAEALDTIFKETGKTVGPLHGIPISLKDQVDLKGIASALGYVSRCHDKKDENSLLADKLLEMGAIFYVKTCVPMAMMAPETGTNLFPYTYNALNINLSSGGSSGGEGALIAAGGARVGFGTDIGGSIRIPASYNGIYGIKPSVGRVSYLRVSNSYANQECIPSVIGPLAQTLEELEFTLKLVVDSKCWLQDPKVLPIGWTQYTIPSEKLKIGIWFDSGDVEPMPAIKRTLKEIYGSLSKSDNFEVVKVEWPEHQRLIKALFDVYGADASKEIMNECAKSGEPLHRLLDYLMDPENKTSPLTINQWWELCNEVYLIKAKYLEFWCGNQLDAIIAPVMAQTQVKPYSVSSLDYTGVCNLCDCSSVVIPLNKVDPIKDTLIVRGTRSDLEKSIRDQYDVQAVDKMPVCVQIITRKLEEEKGLAIASLVQKVVKG